jgi:hypothetical protein
MKGKRKEDKILEMDLLRLHSAKGYKGRSLNENIFHFERTLFLFRKKIFNLVCTRLHTTNLLLKAKYQFLSVSRHI